MALSLVLAGAGLGLQVLGMGQQASAAKSAAGAQEASIAAQAKWTQKRTDWEIAVLSKSLDRELALLDRSGALELAQLRRSRNLLTGTARSRIGASGVTMEGSPMQALQAAQSQMDLEMMTAKQNQLIARDYMTRSAKVQAEGLRMEAAAAQEGAMLDMQRSRALGAEASAASGINMASTILGGIANMYQMKSKSITVPRPTVAGMHFSDFSSLSR